MSKTPNQNNYDPRNLQVIFFALFLFQLLFLAGVVYMVDDATFSYSYTNYVFTLVPFVAIVLDFAGNRFFQNGFAKVASEKELDNALQRLSAIHIGRWLFVESATTVLLVFSIVYSNHFFTAFAVANIIYFSTLRPKLFNFKEQF